jgi:hypothetical protein
MTNKRQNLTQKEKWERELRKVHGLGPAYGCDFKHYAFPHRTAKQKKRRGW